MRLVKLACTDAGAAAMRYSGSSPGMSEAGKSNAASVACHGNSLPPASRTRQAGCGPPILAYGTATTSPLRGYSPVGSSTRTIQLSAPSNGRKGVSKHRPRRAKGNGAGRLTIITLLTQQEFVVSAHPIGEQKRGPIVLPMPTAAAVDLKRIGIPL